MATLTRKSEVLAVIKAGGEIRPGARPGLSVLVDNDGREVSAWLTAIRSAVAHLAAATDSATGDAGGREDRNLAEAEGTVALCHDPARAMAHSGSASGVSAQPPSDNVVAEKYRPSNGTEGDGFIAGWCEICARHENQNCPILAATMAYDVIEPEYPVEWCFDHFGLPQCVAFVPECEPLPPARCQRTQDMFGEPQ